MLKLLVYSAVFSVSLLACSKKSDSVSPQASSKVVKYELTGNYTGKLTIVYTNASGVNENVTYATLPWSKEITVSNDVLSVAFTSSTTSTSTLGVKDQTVTAKLYVGGVVKKSTTSTADVNGQVTLGAMAYVF